MLRSYSWGEAISPPPPTRNLGVSRPLALDFVEVELVEGGRKLKLSALGQLYDFYMHAGT